MRLIPTKLGRALRIPRVDVWSIAKDADTNEVLISRDQYPLHIWFANQFLCRFHPHWSWWTRVWLRIRPSGDPLCEAYIRFYSEFYAPRAEGVLHIVVPEDVVRVLPSDDE